MSGASAIPPRPPPTHTQVLPLPSFTPMCVTRALSLFAEPYHALETAVVEGRAEKLQGVLARHLPQFAQVTRRPGGEAVWRGAARH